MASTTEAEPKKHLIINAFAMGCSGLQCPGLWKHPDDHSRDYKDIDYWVELAKLLEKGKFNAVFLADVLGGYDVYKGPRNLVPAATAGAQWPVNEPSAVVSAMAAVTKSLSFGITFSTISEQPYHLARRIATLDHLTKGRVGWNIVTSYQDSAARNLLNGEPLLEHDERYVKADEFVDVVYKLLLSSWSDDAVILDRERGIFTDPSKIREINHKGKYFDVPGPAITEPSPQRLPVLLQAGTSSVGKDFGAKHAEVIFVISFSPEDLKPKVEAIRKIAVEKYGRERDSIKFVALITTVIGETEEEAKAKFEDYQQYGDLEGAQALFGGWTGIDLSKYGEKEPLGKVSSNSMRAAVENWSKAVPGQGEWNRNVIAKQITIGGLGPVVVGTPKSVADQLERWVDVANIDGFNFTYAVAPKSFEDIVELLLPELRSRGLSWGDYAVPGGTFRENLTGVKGPEGSFISPSHHAHKYRWKAGVDRESFEKSLLN